MPSLLEDVRNRLSDLATNTPLSADAVADDLERVVSVIDLYLGRNPMHPSIESILKYFEWGHLPDRLQLVSQPFANLAQTIANRAPDNPETTVALRKLLEAKDAAVRAAL